MVAFLLAARVLFSLPLSRLLAALSPVETLAKQTAAGAGGAAFSRRCNLSTPRAGLGVV
jgi:hypothetical protein